MTAEQALAVTVSAAAVALACAMMWLGWRRRGGRQRDLPVPPAPAAEPGTTLAGPTEGVYVASTTAGHWLDRVVVHGLGTRSAATMAVTTTGVHWRRQGAPDVFVPAGSLRACGRRAGLAGTVVEPGGLVVVSWDLGGHLLDTGFRPRRSPDAATLVAAVDRLAAARSGS